MKFKINHRQNKLKMNKFDHKIDKKCSKNIRSYMNKIAFYFSNRKGGGAGRRRYNFTTVTNQNQSVSRLDNVRFKA